MSGFTSLNGRSLPFTDNRSPNVVTDYPVAFNIDEIITSKTLTLKRTIEILDVIKPEIANCRLIIDVSSISGVIISWDTLPAGVVINDTNGVYTVQGINSAAIWDAIKEPTITIPDSFDGSFIYTVSINYYNGTSTKTINWQVGTFIPFTLFSCVATLDGTNSITRDLIPTTLGAQFTQYTFIEDIQFTQNRFVLTADVDVILTDEYLSFTDPLYYDPLTLTDISSFAPRVNNVNDSFFVEHQLEIFVEKNYTPQYNLDSKFKLKVNASRNTIIQSFVPENRPTYLIDFSFNNRFDIDVKTNDWIRPFDSISTIDGGFSSFTNQTLTATHSGQFSRFINNYSKFVTIEYDSFANEYLVKEYTYPEKTLTASISLPFTSAATIDINDVGQMYYAEPFTDTIKLYDRSASTWTLTSTANFTNANAIAASSNNRFLITDEENAYICTWSNYSPGSITTLATISRPVGVIYWGGENVDSIYKSKGVRISSNGTRFFIQGFRVGDTTKIYRYSLTNFSPSNLTLLNTLNNTAANVSTNSSMSLVGSNKVVINESGQGVQSFDKTIKAISDDGTMIVTNGATTTSSYIFTGNSTSGWSITDNVVDFGDYFAINSDNTRLLDDYNYAQEVGGYGTEFIDLDKKLIMTGNKARINSMLDGLKLTATNISREDILNYKLISPSVTYTRRQDYRPASAPIRLTAPFVLNSNISLTYDNNISISSLFNMTTVGDQNVFENQITLNASSSLIADVSFESSYFVNYNSFTRTISDTSTAIFSGLYNDLATIDKPKATAAFGSYYNCKVTLLNANGIILSNSAETITGTSIWISDTTSEALEFYNEEFQFAPFNNRMSNVKISQQSGSLGNYQLRYEIFRYDTLTPTNLETSGTLIKDVTVTLTLV